MGNTFAAKAAAWDAAVANIPVPAADEGSLDLIIAVLEKQLDRAIAAVKTNDDKAALAIPSVGAVAGLVGSNVRPDIASHPFLVFLGGSAAAAAILAIILAIVALRPQSLSNGVVALRAVSGVGTPPNSGKLSYLKSLGFTVQSAEDLVRVKAFWVNWAFRVGAAGVVALTALTALGGFAQEAPR